MKILIINGPNLNMLGKRQPEVYGSDSLEDIINEVRTAFSNIEIDHFQSNIEGEIVSKIQELVANPVDGLVVNMGAYTHYSYAILDALNMIDLPKVEVHLSHIFAREKFRHTSVISPACHGMISGFGKHGYKMAVSWIVEKYANGG